MTIGRFEIFNAVVETGSLTKAAEMLNLTQSAVSHAIASLEHEYGFTLINRRKTGVSLTSNGERLLVYMRAILNQHDKLKQEIAAINGLEIGVVRIGTFTSITAQWLPHILKCFEENYPGIEVKLFESDYKNLEQWISEGIIDCGFLAYPISKSLDFLPLKKDRMLCIVSNQHPLHAHDKISFQQIQEEQLIMPKEGWNNEIEQLFRENNIKPNIKFQVSDDQAIIAMVQNNLGISIRPEMTLYKIPNDIRVLHLEKDYFRLIGIASKPNKSPATKKFINCVHLWLSEKNLLNS